MKRRALSRSMDRKVFRRTSKPHKFNSTVGFVMRGGIRK